MTTEEFTQNQLEEIELVIEPVPPDTVDTIKAALEPLMQESLDATAQAQLLDENLISLDLEQTFPTDAAVTALFYLASGIALKTFEVTLLPEIQRRYQARVKKRRRLRPEDLREERLRRTKLRELLATHFDIEELRTLCFDLGIDFDDLRGEGKANKGRELVAYLERRGRIDDLVAVARRMRPHVNWEDT